jgi:NAD(P)H dehydrogenase (quinone)
MTIVVTGATGHLGKLIVDGLLREGVPASDIVAGGRNDEKLAALEQLGVRTVRLDYSDPASLATAFEGADALMLVSGSEVGRRVQQHEAAINAAAAAGIRRIVYTSAPAATNTALAVAPEHKSTEEALATSGLATTILRNGWYNENYLGVLQEARETGTIVASVGDGRVASASRVDYADAAVAVLTGDGHENAVYELTGDAAWSFYDLAATISSIIGRDVTYTPVSSEERLEQLKAQGVPDGGAAFAVALDANIRDGLLGVVNGELSGLIRRPTTPIAETLAQETR